MDEAAIEALMEKIKGAYWNRRLIDDALITTVRSPEIMALLVERLGDSDYSIRTDAGFALAEIVGESAKPVLIESLSSERWQARAAAADALDSYDDFQLTQHLIPLLSDPELPVRIAAINSLESLRDPSSVPNLIEAIEDPERKLYAYATFALYEIARDYEIPELFVHLKSENVHLRVAAAYVLGANGGPDAVRGLIDLVREGIKGDKTEYERAREELLTIGQPAVEELIDALNERDEVLSLLAVEVLVQIGDVRALPHMIAAMGDEDDQVYEIATWGASTFGEKATPLLMDALKSENPRLRANAAQALTEIPFLDISATMIDLLRDSDAAVRQVALTALGDIGDFSAVEPIIALLQGSAQDANGQWTTAYYAAQILTGKLPTPEGIAAVEEWRRKDSKHFN